jgi:hypothetical protein
VQNLGTLGWGDELGAALQGALAKATGTGEFGETYRQARGENRHESAAAKAAHPGYYYGAGAPAALASSIAMPGLKAAQGAGLGLRALVGAGNGALQGAVAGAGDSEAETAGDVAKDALKGGALGGTVGAVLPVAGGAARALLRGVVKPSAAAQELARLGVDTSKLTLGQLNPEGAMAQIEEAGQHAIGSGNVIRGQREAGTQAWRDAVLKKATAPGWGLGPKGDTADKLAGAYETFKPAYEQIGAHAIESAGPGQQSIGDQLRKAFQGAVEDQGVLATDADRAAIGKYLQNQASALKLQPGQASTVGDLQAVRGTVRKDLAQALSGASPNYSSAKLLKNAERALSEHIEQNLPTRAQGLLRDTDARYALYKTVEDAVGRAGDKAEGLMPTHLSAAVKAATENGAYARGGGGELRELAAAGREALQAKSPPTGVRALMQAIPGSHYVQSPVAAVANMDAPKRALLGQTKPQLAMQALADALGLGSETAAQTATASGRQLPLLLQYLRQGGGSPSMSSAAQASDEDRAHQAALAQALASGGNR